MDLRDYLELIRTRWVTLLVCLLLGAGVGGGIAVATPPQYTATAETVVVTQGAHSAAELVQSADFSRQQVRTYSAVAVRPVVLDPVVQELGLEESSDRLAGRVEVTAPMNTPLISIAVTDPSPRQAARIANAISARLADAVHDISATGEGTDGPSVRLVSVRRAQAPTTTSAPDVPVLLGFGLLGGLVLGVCVVALRRSLAAASERAEDAEPPEDSDPEADELWAAVTAVPTRAALIRREPARGELEPVG